MIAGEHTEVIGAKSLDDLRNVEESGLDRVVLEDAKCILKQDRVAAIFREEEAQG